MFSFASDGLISIDPLKRFRGIHRGDLLMIAGAALPVYSWRRSKQPSKAWSSSLKSIGFGQPLSKKSLSACFSAAWRLGFMAVKLQPKRLIRGGCCTFQISLS